MSSSDTGSEGAQAGGYEDRAEAHKRQCERSGAIVDAMRSRMFALLCALFATTGALATCGVAMKAAHDVNGFNENMGREEYASGPFRAEAAAPGNLNSENGMGLTLRRDVTFEVDASVLLRWLGYAAALAAVLVLGFWAAGGDR